MSDPVILRATSRRINLVQTYLRVGKTWATLADLAAAGATGNEASLYRAAQRLRDQGAVLLHGRRGRDGYTAIRFTPDGLHALGYIPARLEENEP